MERSTAAGAAWQCVAVRGGAACGRARAALLCFPSEGHETRGRERRERHREPPPRRGTHAASVTSWKQSFHNTGVEPQQSSPSSVSALEPAPAPPPASNRLNGTWGSPLTVRAAVLLADRPPQAAIRANQIRPFPVFSMNDEARRQSDQLF